MIIIFASFIYCIYSSYKKIIKNKEESIINKNELLAYNIKDFFSVIKEIISKIDVKEYNDTKSKTIKNFLINYLQTLEEYPYLNDFNSSMIDTKNEELYFTLNNIDKILNVYSKIDWRYLITLKSNNYYYLTKLNLLDDVKSFMNILNSVENNQDLTLDYHYI